MLTRRLNILRNPSQILPEIIQFLGKATSEAVLEHIRHPLGAKMDHERHQQQKKKHIKFYDRPWVPNWS